MHGGGFEYGGPMEDGYDSLCSRIAKGSGGEVRFAVLMFDEIACWALLAGSPLLSARDSYCSACYCFSYWGSKIRTWCLIECPKSCMTEVVLKYFRLGQLPFKTSGMACLKNRQPSQYFIGQNQMYKTAVRLCIL